MTPIKKIKFCGFTRQNDISTAVALGVDYLGFVFYQASPRYIDPSTVGDYLSHLALHSSVPVGLFVNHDAELIQEAVMASGVKVLQFHGQESPDFCIKLSQQLGLPYWKALHVTSDTTPEQLSRMCYQYQSADALLFDTALPATTNQQAVWGGTGKTFDWQHLIHLTQHAQQIPPLILSGGLNQDNIRLGIERIQPWAVDVSSGIEANNATGHTIKGIKDSTKMAEFVALVRETYI